MMHVGDIFSTMGDVQYCGEYHDKCGGYLQYYGGAQYHRGTQIPKDLPYGTQDIPHMHHDIPQCY